jgi:hypothetical protein
VSKKIFIVASLFFLDFCLTVFLQNESDASMARRRLEETGELIEATTTIKLVLT